MLQNLNTRIYFPFLYEDKIIIIIFILTKITATRARRTTNFKLEPPNGDARNLCGIISKV